MNSSADEVSKFYESLKEQKLDQNEKSTATWSKYKNDLEVTKSLLSMLPQKLSHSVMVPIGPKALMPGKIVHTNEFLVNLGETWFIKSSASQTVDICNRRIRTCDEMLKKLEDERNLIVRKSSLPAEEGAFGNEETPEIVEYVTEEENEEWKKQHRIKEMEYRKKLAELRNEEKKTIDTEEALWKHLDELELQEELEDELHRLNEQLSSEDDSEKSSEPEHFNNSNGMENNKVMDQIANDGEVYPSHKKKVSFAYDLDMADDEPLRLEIKHSKVHCSQTKTDTREINSPRDIYDLYIKAVPKVNVPVLKKSVNPNYDKEQEKVGRLKETGSSDGENDSDIENIHSATGIQFNDIVERNISSAPSASSVNMSIVKGEKKISKFKALRTKKLYK